MSPKELAEIEARNKQARTYMNGAIAAGVKPYIDGDDVRVVLDTVDALLAEVRRLTPAPKVAKFKRYPSGFSVLTVDGCAVGASISATASGVWQAWADRQFENFDSEPEARAHIEAWARGKGWEVRDA